MKKLCLFSVALILLFTLISCATSATTPATSSPASNTQTSTPTATGAQPQYGGMLKVATNRGPQVIGYPPKMIEVDLFSIVPAIETLVKWGLNDTIIPSLATSWDVSDDLKSLTFTLRQGVKFQDGTDFNAAAAKWNLDAQKQVNRPELVYVSSIDAVDDYTLRLNLSQFSNALLQDLAHYAGLMVSPSAVQKNGVDWAAEHPVGTGPFKLVSFTRDVSIKYEKFTDYWDTGKPYLDGVQYDYISDLMTVQAAFMVGDIDMYRTGSSSGGKMASELQAAGITVDRSPGSTLAIWFDSKNADSHFADIRVRQAVEYAIDKKAITDALGYGFMTVCDESVPPGVAAYNPNLTPRSYDPEKAKQLLAEAGYPDGFSTRLITPTAGVSRDVVTALQGYLGKVGITAEVQVVDSASWAEVRSKGWEDAMVHYATSYPTGNYAVYMNRETPVDYSLWPVTQRPDGYGDLLNQIFSATDPNVQVELNQKFVKMLYDDEFFAPIYIGFLLGIKQPWVHDETMCVVHQMAWYPGDTWIDKK